MREGLSSKIDAKKVDDQLEKIKNNPDIVISRLAHKLTIFADMQRRGGIIVSPKEEEKIKKDYGGGKFTTDELYELVRQLNLEIKSEK